MFWVGRVCIFLGNGSANTDYSGNLSGFVGLHIL